jgi:rfaE bifunctional protein nucleotidyltransferase chain/domain
LSTSTHESALDRADKVVRFDELRVLAARARSEGLRIVHSHGIFDLLHPGHIEHLQQARALGDMLVVSVTSDRYVKRGPGRPVFSAELRMRSLAALGCVDHVVLSDHESAVPVIDALRPDVYVKGSEYADEASDVRGNFAAERARVAELGGETRLLGGAVYSSTRLLNQHFDVLPPAARTFAGDFSMRWDAGAIREIVDSFASLRVLVVGEVIIDEYVTCDVLGVTPKERIPSVRPLASRRFLGGAYAVARHLATCCGSVSLASIADRDQGLLGRADADPAASLVQCEFESDPAFPTIVKQRFVVENKLRAELTKVFAVSRVPDPELLDEATRARFRQRIAELLDDADLVVVSDYGHGLLDHATIALLEQHAPTLSLNCQTNSANWGFNPITKYSRADSFCLDVHELSLAYRVKTQDHAPLLHRLRGDLRSSQGWLTLGAAGAIGCDDSGTTHPIPALTLHVRDTLGAGDAFFSWSSAAAATGQPLEVGSFLGSVAGALATNITGNERPAGKSDVLRLASTLLTV